MRCKGSTILTMIVKVGKKSRICVSTVHAGNMADAYDGGDV